MSNFKKWVRKVLRKTRTDAVRTVIASLYLRGTGIEIGALHNPLKVFRVARISYVDRMTVDELRKHYPELQREKLVTVDIVDNGEQLATIPDCSQAFVIANHFIEHCENPLLALDNMLRVLKPLGVLYLAVPDKRFTFDIDRPTTPLGHLLADYTLGAEQHRVNHYAEWVRYVNKVTDTVALDKEVIRLMDMEYSIHFHSWTQQEMLEMLLSVKQRHTFDIEMLVLNLEENIFIIRKLDDDVRREH
jgi:predicted SAM-dependent methyltransferase